jgi:hypothetical protein
VVVDEKLGLRAPALRASPESVEIVEAGGVTEEEKRTGICPGLIE